MTSAERAPSWVPVLLALVANCWVVRMPFQADDYLILPEVGAILGIADSAPSDDPRADAHIGNFYLFRPVPWLLWWLLIQMRGGLADPLVFHATALLLHAAATFVLQRVLRAVFHPFAAMLGAAAFAAAPGAVQATSYIAAGGDLLAVLFMLLAARLLQLHRIRPGGAKVAAAAVCAALAFCSKEVAVASLPAVFLAAWAVPSPGRVRLWRPIAAVLLGCGVAIAARALYLKNLMPAYLGAPKVGLSNLRDLDGLFLELLAPWRRCPGLEDLAPVSARIAEKRSTGAPALRLLALACFVLPVVPGLLSSVRAWRKLAAIAAAMVCVLLPALVIWHEDSIHVVSRALYPAATLAGAALAAGLEPLAARGRRFLPVVLLVPLAVLWADFMVHVARTELRAGERIRGRLSSMEELLAVVPRESRVLAVDPEFELGCIPLVYFGIGNAMKPPFSEPGRARVAWWGDLATLPRGGILQEHAGPIVIARLSEGRYVEREPRIPELPASLPPLTRSPDRPGEWTFATPPPARAVSGLRVSAGSQGVFGCRWIGSRGTRETRGSLPGLGGEARAIVSAPEDFDWLADPMVLGVRFEGVDPSGVEPLRELAEITIATPRRRARIPVGGLPDITFVPPPQPRSQEYRLTVEFAISHDERPLMISEEPAFILQDRGGGTLAYDVTRQRTSRFVGSSEIDAETFFGRRLGDALRASGSGLLPLSIRVEGFDPASGAVECRSDWRICFLENR